MQYLKNLETIEKYCHVKDVNFNSDNGNTEMNLNEFLLFV